MYIIASTALSTVRSYVRTSVYSRMGSNKIADSMVVTAWSLAASNSVRTCAHKDSGDHADDDDHNSKKWWCQHSIESIYQKLTRNSLVIFLRKIDRKAKEILLIIANLNLKKYTHKKIRIKGWQDIIYDNDDDITLQLLLSTLLPLIEYSNHLMWMHTLHHMW